MDEVIINGFPSVTPSAEQFFDVAMQFGVIMLLVGLFAGFLIGYGYMKFIRGGVWPGRDQSDD